MRTVNTTLFRGKITKSPVVGLLRNWSSRVLFLLVVISTQPCGADDLQTDQRPADAPPTVNQERLRSLIANIRIEEARYQNYLATWRRSFIDMESQQSMLVTTTRQRVQGDLFKVRCDDEITLAVDEKRFGWRESVFDGKTTIAIEGHNSVCEYAGRTEPAHLVPPSAWGLFAQDVCFPLSVLLSGTDAIKALPKTNWYPSDRPTPFAIRATEVISIADEAIDGLECVKVRIKRWSLGMDTPSLMDLWLAKDRNWHIVHCKTFSTEDGREVPINDTSAKKWSKAAPDLWFPRLFESSLVQPNGDLKIYMRLVIESLELNPAIASDEFKIGVPPADLPRFVVDEQHRLVGSPHHPVPMNSARSSSLDEILQRLALEEQKYNSLDLELVKRRSSLNPRESSLAGEIYESQERYVKRGEQRYAETVTSQFFSNSARSGDQQLVKSEFQLQQQSDDGTVLRTVRSQRFQRDGRIDTFAAIDFQRTGHRLPLRPPHSLLFEEVAACESLAKFLQSGWYDELAGARMEVEYEGDEQIDDLICHRLNCNLPKLLPTTPKSHFVAWLARDRNLLPVRREQYDEKDHGTLPIAVSFTSAMREVQPGCWFPVQSSILQLQRNDRNSLVMNCFVLRGRIDWGVIHVTLGPMVDGEFFSELQISQGTQIGVIETNRTQWTFIQKKDGRIEVSTDPAIRSAQREETERVPQNPTKR